jgi:hypothetical protein
MTNHRLLMTTSALSGAMAVSALVLAAGAAQAATASFNSGTNITIATQSLNSAGTISLSQTAQNLTITLINADTCSAGNTLTLTAPAGVTFGSVPNISIAGGVGGTLASGTVQTGSSSVLYTFSGNTMTNTNSNVITIGGSTNPFFLTTGSTFSTANTTVRVFTVSSTCGTFTVPTVANGLLSASGFSPTTAAGTTATVDTTATGAGKLFTTSATATTRVATLGTISVAASSTVDAGNGSAYTISSGSSVTTTLTGSFTAVSRLYAVTASCVTTAGGSLPSGSITGTVSGSTVSLTGMATGTTYTLCYENNGSTVIQAGGGTALPITATASVSNLTGSTSSATVGNLLYSGAAATLNYVTGGSAYQYFVRVTNPGSATTSVFAVVTKEDGSSTAGSLNTSLGINSNALYSITDVNTATGANLSAADRARVQILTSSSSATVSGILFNTATGVIATSN